MTEFVCIGGPWDGETVKGRFDFDETGRCVNLPPLAAGCKPSRYIVDFDNNRFIHDGLRARKKEQA